MIVSLNSAMQPMAESVLQVKKVAIHGYIIAQQEQILVAAKPLQCGDWLQLPSSPGFVCLCILYECHSDPFKNAIVFHNHNAFTQNQSPRSHPAFCSPGCLVVMFSYVIDSLIIRSDCLHWCCLLERYQTLEHWYQLREHQTVETE